MTDLPPWPDTAAAEYVLGTLDRRSAQQLEAALRANPALRAEIAAWERRLAPLADLAPAADPPPGSWDALEQAIDRTPQRVLNRPLDDTAWHPLAPGIERKTLWNDETFLLRLAPGATLRAHAHQTVEHCLVLQGEMVVEGASYGPGHYQGLAAGTRHKPLTAPNGLLVLIRYGD